jgi:polysaccharide biosynthesis/export protein
MILLLLMMTLQRAPRAEIDPALYVIGPNDVLGVTVFNQPQLSGKFRVEADGTLAFPLVGRVAVGGSNVRAAEAKIVASLAAGYLTDPRVSVTVEEYRSQQIFVMGEVRQPGPLQFTGSMTLIEALARVGSTTERAGAEAIVVRPAAETMPPAATSATQPGKDSKSETIHVKLESLQTGELSENVPLRAGDTIFVPRAATVFVSGQVKAAGEYVIHGGMTVREALALAGGVSERGSTRRLQVIRQVDGKRTTFDATLDTELQPSDTIVVRERFM